MKIYPEKLSTQIRKSIAPLYIVSGDEPLLVQECCDMVRKSLKEQGFLERDLYHVDAVFDWDKVLFSANSMSLFAEKKLIELRLPSGKPGDKGNKALLAYLAEPSPDTSMLLVLPKVDASSQRSKWFKALEAGSVFVQIWPIEVANLPRWINDRFRQVGLSATKDAVLALIDRIEGNLLAAVQEIDRLRLIAKSDQVDVDLVMEAVSDSARYDVFALIDAAIGQNSARTLKVVRGLRAESTEILLITNMLARELRGLVSMAQAVAQGQRIDAVLQSYRVWAKRKPLVGRCLQSQSSSILEKCLHSIAKIDRQVKGLSIGDPWNELERLVLMLSGRTVL